MTLPSATLPDGWNLNSKGELEREYNFENFSDAMVFVNRCAEIAEEMNHHPNIFLHDWKMVNLTLFTHSEGKITKKDYELAQKINSLLK